MKNVLAVFSALAIALLTFQLFEFLGHIFYQPAARVQINNPDPEGSFAALPVESLLFVLMGWLIGSVLAGVIIRLVSREASKVLPLIVASVLTVAAIINLFMLPHPLWFIIIGLVTFFPAVFLGFTLASGRSKLLTS